jgi:hypothetical protein
MLKAGYNQRAQQQQPSKRWLPFGGEAFFYT